MLKQDKIWVGALSGLVFPVFFFIIFHELNSLLVHHNMLPGDGVRPQFICIISVIANVLLAGSYVQSKRDNALRGIVAVTMLYVAGIVIYFYKELIHS